MTGELTTARVGTGTTAPSALTGFIGVAVVLVMLQSTSGFAVELLGPDLILVSAGFAVTYSVLLAGRGDLETWYRTRIALHTPLLVGTLAAVSAAVAVVGPYTPAGLTTADALAAIGSSFTWWGLAPTAGSVDQVNPLGALWLVGLLAQFCLVWPILLTGLCRMLTSQRRPWVAAMLPPLLAGMALLTGLVGPLRALAGAGVAELTLGAHVRLSEWLVGAAAAAAVLRLSAGRPTASPSQPTHPQTYGLAAVGLMILLAMAFIATLQPDQWLRAAGPNIAALGAAAVLLALHSRPDGPLAQALARGFPYEIGRTAFPLLLLHLPLYWAMQLAVPSVRPFALLAVGGSLTWLLGLLLHDGLVRRWQAHVKQLSIAVLLLAVALAAVTVSADSLRAAGNRVARSNPVVLVVGGSSATDLAAALGVPGSPMTVVDASRPGCGLLGSTGDLTTNVRSTSTAQAPVGLAMCGDAVEQWRSRIDAVQPDVVVADLGADRVAAGYGPCDPQYRLRFRDRFADAVEAWTHGARDRTVLLATLAHDPDVLADTPHRCANALLTESMGSYRPVVPLDLRTVLCPNDDCRTAGWDGRPLFDESGRLSQAGIGDLSPWLREEVTAEVRRPRVAESALVCYSTGTASGC